MGQKARGYSEGMSVDDTLKRYRESIDNIDAALVFMLHGTMKLFGYPPTDQPRPELMSLLGLAGSTTTRSTSPISC